MPFRSYMTIIALAFQLCGCVTNQAAIEDMERRHTRMMETTGGGSGM